MLDKGFYGERNRGVEPKQCSVCGADAERLQTNWEQTFRGWEPLWIKVCRRKSAGLGQIHKPLLKNYRNCESGMPLWSFLRVVSRKTFEWMKERINFRIRTIKIFHIAIVFWCCNDVLYIASRRFSTMWIKRCEKWLVSSATAKNCV